MIAARFLLSGALVLLMGGAATAQDFQPKQKGLVMLNVRASGVLTDADGSIRTAVGADSGLKAKVGDDVMPTIGLTYFFTDHLAVEAIAGTTQHEVKAVGPGVDVTVHKTWVLPPVVSLQYHFAPDARISPYVGAGLNYMLFYRGKDRNGFKVDIDDGFGYALQAGVDVALKDRWSANLDVKKVFFETDASINDGALKTKVKLDPWVVSAGVGYKF
ncbi:OmpW family protein [Phenylobacterium sp.]|jgi:outer membrane protein|uniref:OmpW/AlkL family protein n=1 Tax=Phenylobacterium sp. TaxID=1871053 RepID=UPI0035AF4988